MERGPSGRGPSYARMVVKSSIVTQVFHVPLEERHYKEMKQGFGETGSQFSKIRTEVMKNSNVRIEMSLAKDQSLTFVMTGKEDAVVKARREVMNKLHMQANITIQIPKEHHRFIIGKEGKKLKELEQVTMTKITIPNIEENSDMITIVGRKEGIDQARHELQLISDEQAKRAYERLIVPYKYHPFICGPDNCFIKELSARTGAKISVPPLSARKDEIVVAGEKDGVHEAKALILRIYEEKKLKATTVSLEVRKSQHCYVIGPHGSNLADILKETGVSVEVPPSDSPSETITLRGEQSQLGPAITQVYAKANRVFERLIVPYKYHPFICGPDNCFIKDLSARTGAKISVPPLSARKDEIVVAGEKDGVHEAKALILRIYEEKKLKTTTVSLEVRKSQHRYVIGPHGSNLADILKETGVSVEVPPSDSPSEIITLRGEQSQLGPAVTQVYAKAHSSNPIQPGLF